MAWPGLRGAGCGARRDGDEDVEKQIVGRTLAQSVIALIRRFDQGSMAAVFNLRRRDWLGLMEPEDYDGGTQLLQSSIIMNSRTIVIASLLAVMGLTGAVAYAATPAGTTSTPNTTGSETVDGVLSKASGVAGTAARATKRGVKKAANAVEHGGAVAGKAVNRTAKKIGLPAGSETAKTMPPASSPQR